MEQIVTSVITAKNAKEYSARTHKLPIYYLVLKFANRQPNLFSAILGGFTRKKLTPPIFPVKAAVVNGFCYMFGLNTFGVTKVGNGAAHF